MAIHDCMIMHTSSPVTLDKKINSLSTDHFFMFHLRYELHYQLITFGKVNYISHASETDHILVKSSLNLNQCMQVFCTKSKPNCNACPMRGECRHFASAFARYISENIILHPSCYRQIMRKK